MRWKRVFQGTYVHVDLVDTGQPVVSEIVGTKGRQFSVGVLVYQPQTDTVFLVSQDRVAVATEENPKGTITEVVAGRCDKDGKSIVATIISEVLEEIGVEIAEEDIMLLNEGKPLAVSPGILKERMVLAYVELPPTRVVREDRTYGIEEEGESIEVVVIPATELELYRPDDMKTFALIQWYLNLRRQKDLSDRLKESVGRLENLLDRK